MALTGLETGYIVVYIGDVSAGDDLTAYLLKPDRKMVVNAVQVGVSSATSADGTNYVTIAVRNGSNDIASRATNSADLEAGITSLTVNDSYKHVDADGVVSLVITHAGTGAALADLTVILKVGFED